MDYKTKEFIGIGILCSLGIFTCSNMGYCLLNTTDRIKEGYIDPNSVEFQSRDLDGNGELETLIIDDKKYFIKRTDGKPFDYKVIPFVEELIK